MQQARKFASFFDDDSMIDKQKKIWEKPKKNQVKLSSFQSFLTAVFYKKTKKADKLKKITLSMDYEYLIYQKGEKKTDAVNGLLDLTCAKLEQETLDENALKSYKELKGATFAVQLRITRNCQRIELIVTSEQVFQQWKKVLNYRLIQTTFHEEFLVTKMIGKGSFAKVYLATKKENKLNYAIKAFNKEFMLTQHKGRESLINEITIMRSLNHDNLIHLYETYETTNSIYFVVDLLEGGELLHRLREKDNFSHRDLKLLIRKLMEALHHLHIKNIMHRDLKPENLLLKSKDNYYDITIADFGLATLVNVPMTNILFKRCGTPGFVAPEVLAFKEEDPFYSVVCDIFSAGVIFYLLLTGKQPFTGKDYKQILRANKACEINFDIPELHNQSPETIDLLKRMLEADPKKRISSAQCLDHPFLLIEKELEITTQALDNLKNYEVDFVYVIRNKVPDSQEKIGSYMLIQHQSAMNGKTDTYGSFGNLSHSSIDSQKNVAQNLQKSKFQRTASIENKMTQDSGFSPMNKGGDLRKQALQNSMYKRYQEEKKRDSDSDKDQDISEEGQKKKLSENEKQISNVKRSNNFQK